jgi:hypothetical protein
MREKHLWIALVLAILCTLGVRAATADELSSKTRPLNMTGTWYTTGWPWPNDNMFYLVAFKKPTEEQGTILGFWKWYGYFPDSTSIQRWHISGWYISNYFEITATNPLPIALCFVGSLSGYSGGRDPSRWRLFRFTGQYGRVRLDKGVLGLNFESACRDQSNGMNAAAELLSRFNREPWLP